MRKSYTIILLGILTIVLGIVVGIIIGNNNNSSELLENSKTKLAEENIINSEIELVTTSNVEIKTTPNTLLIFKTYYKDCNHTAITRKNISEDLVNLTQEELAKKYEKWKIEEFKKGEVVLIKEEAGICDEHYVIRENNGYIAIYKIDASGKEVLKETTDIVTSYLPNADKKELKDGIKIIGKDELNACLEDYE